VTATNTLQSVVSALDAAGIPHMIAGSFASSLHGLARTTADIDIVIDPAAGAIEEFIAHLDRERFYVAESAALEATELRSQFNVIDTTTGWKIDLIVRKDRPFSRMEMSRRVPVTIVGVPVMVATPEDTVLAKLEWSAMGQSERQFQDVVEILRIHGPNLDAAYLEHWASELGVSALLERARRAA